MCCHSNVHQSSSVNVGCSSTLNAAVPVTLTATEKKKLQWAQEQGLTYMMTCYSSRQCCVSLSEHV